MVSGAVFVRSPRRKSHSRLRTFRTVLILVRAESAWQWWILLVLCSLLGNVSFDDLDLLVAVFFVAVHPLEIVVFGHILG